jgi:hypothetical protein
LGVALLPRTVAVVIAKILKARLVNQGGERVTLAVAVAAALVAVFGYPLVIPALGALGAAATAGVLFGAGAAAVAVALRRGPRRPAGRDLQRARG